LTELRRGWGDLFAQPASFQKLITKEVRSHYPDLDFHLFLRKNDAYVSTDSANPAQLPAWLDSPHWRGVVLDNGAVYFRSLCFGESPQGKFATELSVPLTDSII